MSEPLFSCPRCDRYGFYPDGLRKHVCRGVKPGDERRRLTPRELKQAEKVAEPKR